MSRLLLTCLVVAACLGCGAAYAQSPGYPEPSEIDQNAMPSLTLPNDMTNPTLSGLGPDDANKAPPANGEQPNTLEPAPYSVDGEEPLDPGGN